MKKNQTILIGGNNYKYKYLGKSKDGSRMHGGLKVIEITELDGLDVTQSIFHELFHAVCYEHPANAKLKELFDDEEAIEILTKELTGCLRQLGIVR